MKRLQYIFVALVAMLNAGFSGCSDNIDMPGSHVVPEGIILQVPNPKGLAASATRSDEKDETIDIAEKEGTIKNLYLVAFDESGNFVKAVNLEKNSGELNSHDKYKTYQLEGILEYGIAYRLYVVANLDSFISGIDWNDLKNENKFKDLVLNFKDASNKYLLNSADMPNNGLPMACLHSELMLNGNSVDDAITFEKGKECVIHADLTFLVAKVRYTILFDNVYDGESGIITEAHKVFGDTYLSLKSASAENLLNNATKIEGSVSNPSGYFNLEGLSLKSVVYPENPDDYPESDQRFVDLDEENNPSLEKKAWQGTFYLPENLSDKHSGLLLKGDLLEYNGDRISGQELSYRLSLLPIEDEDNLTTIRRGHAYDIVANVTGLQTLKINKVVVEPWTIEQLNYILQRPVFLHVDKTAIPVTAGETTAIWYDTDADGIKPESPKFTKDNKEYDIYSFNIEGDSLFVSVNPEIKADWFKEIRDGGNSFNFFHITAGTLHKKIDVSPLTLHRYLTVSPTNITIDVREQIASGHYSGSFDVVVKTNLNEFSLSDLSAWTTDENLVLKDKNGNIVSSTSNFKPENGEYRFKVEFKGLNSGAEIWAKTSKQFKFLIEADNEGIEMGEDYIFPQTVTVNVLPANDFYTIHFRATGWDNPHIYVYQCLELPASYKEMYNGQLLASKPVGYKIWHDDDKYWQYFSALEYSFTGKIAFKGWDDPINKTFLNTNQITEYSNGFIILTDYWNPAESGSDNKYYKDQDFFADYRPLCGCYLCNNEKYNKVWPGIRMSKEDGDNNGWWKIELTALATPGKALIMFSNGHDGDSNKRYPEANAVGLSLFDYPSREGWFDYNGSKTFTPEKPGFIAESKTRRIYYTNPDGWNPPHVWYWNMETNFGNTWPGPEMKKDANGYWYYDIDKNATQLLFNPGGDNGKTGNLTVSADKNVYDRNGANDSYNTDPIPDNSISYRIYWYKSPESATDYRNFVKYNDGTKGCTTYMKPCDGSEEFDGAVRFYVDLSFDTDSDQFFAACNSSGNQEYGGAQGGWMNIKTYRNPAPTGKSYKYTVVIY